MKHWNYEVRVNLYESKYRLIDLYAVETYERNAFMIVSWNWFQTIFNSNIELLVINLIVQCQTIFNDIISYKFKEIEEFHY